MTVTERTHELLDERGVEYHEYRGQISGSMEPTTRFYVHDDEHRSYASIETASSGSCVLLTLRCTPEQAVAATLGAGDAYTREECEASFVRGYSLGSLPVGSDPRWDENRQTVDEHMAELGWVRKDAASLANDRVADLQAENTKLRELLVSAFDDMVAWQRIIACSDQWGYGRGCREQLWELRDAMRDLGVEVDFDGR